MKKNEVALLEQQKMPGTESALTGGVVRQVKMTIQYVSPALDGVCQLVFHLKQMDLVLENQVEDQLAVQKPMVLTPVKLVGGPLTQLN